MVAPISDPIADIEAEMAQKQKNWKPAEGWAKLKTITNEARQKAEQAERRAAELETKLKTAPVAAGMTAEQIDALKAESKALSDRLMVMDLENHPSFKTQFVEPKKAELAKAEELLAANGVKGDVAALLSKPRSELGKAVQELVKDLPDYDRVEVAQAIRNAYQLDNQGKAALANSKQLNEQIGQQSIEKHRQAFLSKWAPVSAAVGEFIQPLEISPNATSAERADAEAYNQSIAGLKDSAEKLALGTTSSEQVAEAAIKAAAYDMHIGQVMPRLAKEIDVLIGERDALRNELLAIRGRNPNHGIRPLTGGGGDAPKSPDQMGHSEAADHFFHQ